ncbi:cobalamin biosynthesis protein [Chloroflexota bacterium]
MDNVYILLIAIAVDLTIGEYPRFMHPVEWLGPLITIEIKAAPKNNKKAQFAYGTLVVLLTVAAIGAGVYYLLAYLKGINYWAYILVAAFLLKSTFSARKLCWDIYKIKKPLDENDMQQARQRVSYVVSRDTARLEKPQVVSAAVESLAESTADSIVSPLIWFLVLGVPGAVAYRVINTFDARIGYRGVYEHLGKFAARLDDIVNYIPARISGLLIVIAAYLSQSSGRVAWCTMLQDHKQTSSPNAGWPMSAMAGALNTQLEKTGHYSLGTASVPLVSKHITLAIKLVLIAALTWAATCILVEVLKYVITT